MSEIHVAFQPPVEAGGYGLTTTGSRQRLALRRYDEFRSALATPLFLRLHCRVPSSIRG